MPAGVFIKKMTLTNPHKAGFANIIGLPNVGKSTLLNALMGTKLSIVSPKAQTTRHRIRTILSGEGYQIVISDTPGIIQKPGYKLHDAMNEYISQALTDADVFILVTEAGMDAGKTFFPEKLKTTKRPVIHVLNKIDQLEQTAVISALDEWKKVLPRAIHIPVSAVNQFNIASVLDEIVSHLPEHEPYFPDDELSDRNLRFFASEIIRENIFLQYQQEIPYCCEVQVEEFSEKQDIYVIKSIVYVSRDSQKSIIIGEKGKAIKRLGMASRKRLEEFLGIKVFLDISVKVAEDWRSNSSQIQRFGY